MRTVYKILTSSLLIYLLVLDIIPIPNIKFSFLCQDPKLSHAFTGETVSAKILLLVASLGPLVIVTIVEILKENSLQPNRTTIWILYRRCLIGSVFVVLITECIKSIVKEPRPHFFHSCKPDTNKNCQPHDDFIFDYNCTNDQLSRFYKSDLVRSFPSGHSSLSVFVALYCSYLIQVRIPSNSKRSLLKPFLILICLSWSLLCCMSRISDKRHHWWDVLGGAVLGIGCGLYTLYLFHRHDSTKFGTNSYHCSQERGELTNEMYYKSNPSLDTTADLL